MRQVRILTSTGSRERVAFGLVLLCVALASGRMNTSATDGASQLAQAVHFCVTGHLAAGHAITSEFSPRGFSSTSAFYDSNDIGGTLLMLPAACIAALHGARDPASLSELTNVAKAGASMTFSVIGAIGVVFVMLALAELVGLRRSSWWALAFLFSTGFLAYVKGTWDVLPAATAVAMLVWVTVRCRVGKDGARRTLMLAALAVGLASLCRYTLAPFLAVAAVAAVWPAVRDASVRQRVEATALLAALLVPDFVWNQMRTGAFWKPGQANPGAAFDNYPHLTLHYLLSTFGLFFGIHEGLLFYAPVCLLGYVGVVAYIARSRGGARLAWATGLALAMAYVVTISVLHIWETFAWGPRYLVPLYPALFVIAALAIERRLIPRALGYASVVAGTLVGFPLVFANWHAVVAIVGIDHRAPNAIVGLWRSMIDGLATGHGFGAITTLVGPGYGGDSSSYALQVPDVWWWHLIARDVPHVLGPLALVGVGAAITKWIIAAARPDDAGGVGPAPRRALLSTPPRARR